MNAKLKLVFTCLLWGSIGLFVRAIPLTSAEIISVRALIAVLLFIGINLCAHNFRFYFPRYQKKSVLKVILAGICMGVTWLCLFSSYKYTTVSIATLCHYIGPILVACFSPLIFKERFSIIKLLAIVVSALGLYLVIYHPAGAEGVVYQHVKGILLALASSVLYGAVIILNKVSSDVSGFDKTMVQMGAAALIFLPTFVGSFGAIMTSGFISWGLLLILGLIHTGLAYFLYFSALRTAPAQDVILIGYLDPISAVFFSIIFLHEPFTLAQFVGAFLILGATFFSDQIEHKLKLRKMRRENESTEDIDK